MVSKSLWNYGGITISTQTETELDISDIEECTRCDYTFGIKRYNKIVNTGEKDWAGHLQLPTVTDEDQEE